DAIGFAQSAGGDLSWSRFFTRAGSGKSKYAAGPQAQDAADDALLPHANADERPPIALLLQKFHHQHVVVEPRGGGYDFEKVGWHAQHAVEDLFQVLGDVKVVIRKNEGGVVPDLLKIRRL